MVVNDSHLCIVFALVQGYDDLKGQTVVHMFDGNGSVLQESTHSCDLLGRNLCNNLQFLGSITTHDAGNSSCGDTLHMVGIGHDNTLNVLNNATAGTNDNLVGHSTQNFSCLRCAVSQCDRLGAAHGGDQFFFQDLNIRTVLQIVFCHDCFHLSHIIPLNNLNLRENEKRDLR